MNEMIMAVIVSIFAVIILTLIAIGAILEIKSDLQARREEAIKKIARDKEAERKLGTALSDGVRA